MRFKAFSSRPVRIRLQPWAARAWAIARPMPRVAPVMRATWPCNSRISAEADFAKCQGSVRGTSLAYRKAPLLAKEARNGAPQKLWDREKKSKTNVKGSGQECPLHTV